jgi:hypothetical protein
LSRLFLAACETQEKGGALDVAKTALVTSAAGTSPAWLSNNVERPLYSLNQPSNAILPSAAW